LQAAAPSGVNSNVDACSERRRSARYFSGRFRINISSAPLALGLSAARASWQTILRPLGRPHEPLQRLRSIVPDATVTFQAVGSSAGRLGLTQSLGIAWAEDCVVPVAGVAGNVTLRRAPSANSPATGALSEGESLPLVALMRGWYETRLATGQPAFAAKRSTDLAPCSVAFEPVPGPGAGIGPNGVYEVHAIDVGTGLSVLVRGSDFSLLYDAGSNDDMARGEGNRTIAYLKTLSPDLQKLDHVVLSHPHRDHVELLPDVISQFGPDHVWNSGAYNNICGYRNFLLAIQANPTISYHTATQDVSTETVELPKAKCYGVQQPTQRVDLKHGTRITDEKIILGRGASMTFLYADGSKRTGFTRTAWSYFLSSARVACC
jgi:hypothetical protein